MSLLRTAALTLVMAVPGMGQDVGLMVVPFEGPGDIGARAAKALDRQLRATLSAAPPSDPRQHRIRKGTIYFTPEDWRPVRNHIEAERGADGHIHAVLWGRAQPYGDSVVVRTYLSVPRARSADHPGTAIWKIGLPDGQPLSVDIPAWRYEFEPIVVRAEAGLQFGSAVDFSGALFRVFCMDWGGALELFGRVAASRSAPTGIKAYSLLMMAAASELLGVQTGRPSRAVNLVEQSYQLNPYLQATIRYECMAHLAAMARTASARQQLAETVARNEYLFSSKDRWIGRVKAVLAR